MRSYSRPCPSWRYTGLTIACAAILALAAPASQAAGAADWPGRPITLVAPSAPGGATDSVGKILGRYLETYFHQPVVVVTKPGAGATIGAAYVRSAAPDGYVLLISGSSTHSANPYLFKTLSYNPASDFRDVGMVGFIPAVGLVRSSLPIRSAGDLIAYAKAHPGKLSYGHATSSSQVPPAIIAANANIDVLGAAYKSLSQIIIDIAGGIIDFAFLDIMSAQPALKLKEITPFAVTSPKRDPMLPDVPAVSEALPGYEVRSWIGIAAPAQTPDEIVEKLSAGLNKALGDAPTKAALQRLGMTVQPMSVAEMGEFTRADRERWKGWVKLANIQPR
ncbi:tripartite tricarboxylate transporter substrate binding protein [Bordetella sp. BOR01]|uniref:Bug family tripartite tricarboxylate transporter substrate binding protein n=1 Tax=Bordetella sp. BOR01 TaxID=2854779 RepID=UPI001C44794F|nr:tripartite tricarboxylate transporter substrate binding protein [Bordetella sp. BOR01]MBV7482178.1 tripartite tricarboxylate transporter substrate binding protein [Bordetella sp. BOR01]